MKSLVIMFVSGRYSVQICVSSPAILWFLGMSSVPSNVHLNGVTKEKNKQIGNCFVNQ